MTRCKPQWDYSAFQRFRLALCRRRRRARSRPARAPEGIWTLFHYLIAERGTVEFDNLRLCIVRGPECR